jgi:hypothetical protein
MLIHPTLDLLHSLGLHGMAKGFKDHRRQLPMEGLTEQMFSAVHLRTDIDLLRAKIMIYAQNG